MIEQSTRSTVYLVDGTSQLFRAYYAIRGLSNDDGLPTNAVFGFTSMLRKLITDENPEYIAVAWDRPGKTFRHELDPNYKANRPEIDEELKVQFPYAKQVCDAFNIPGIEMDLYEADDLIATLAHQALEEGFEVVIVASDKDLLQLVRPGVKVFNPTKNQLMDEEGVFESYGARPENVLDVQALMGDSVDNIPGVAGVGEKTSKTVVNLYGDLESIIQYADAFANFIHARDDWLEAHTGPEKLKALDETTINAMQEATQKTEACLDALLQLERAEEYKERLEEARKSLTEFADATSPLLVKDEPGKPLGKVIRPAKKALKDLDRKSGKRHWLAISEQQEAARKSRVLAKLNEESPIEFDAEDIKYAQPNREAAHALFKQLGFRTLTKEFSEAGQDSETVSDKSKSATSSKLSNSNQKKSKSGASKAAAPEDVEDRVVRGEYETIYDIKALKAWIKACHEAGRFAIDTETDGLDPMRAKLVGISMSYAPGEGVYIPIGHDYLGAPDQLALEEVQEHLAPLLIDPKVGKVAQNLKYDLHILRRHGLPVDGWELDTMVAAFLLQSDRKSFKMDALAKDYLGVTPIPFESIAGKGAKQVTLNLIDVETVSTYAAEDADVTLRLAAVLEPRLQSAGLRTLYEQVDGPLLPMLARMEAHGIEIDSDLLAKMSAEIEDQLSSLRQSIHTLAGAEFNVDSPKQLREILFDKLGLKSSRKTTKSKVASTDHQTLETLAEEHEIARNLLEYRELAKLKGTYIDALPKLVNPETGRVHTSYHPAGAATGRLSSSDPNLQNIPVRTAAGRKIRAAFVPAKGHRFLASDYSQVELRVLAHLCQDEQLIEAFRAGEDIHRHTAAIVAGIPQKEVSDAMRQRAKAVNFGILYGMSSTRLAREQGMTREEASAFIDEYFDRFPSIRRYIETVREQAMGDGKVRTLFGRVRHFPQLHQRVHRGIQEQALRAAVNTTIQGTAADLMKMAMLKVEKRLNEADSKAKILLQVHDELMIEVPESEEEQTARLVREAMEQVETLAVPLKVDQKFGKNWAEVK